MRIVIFTEVLSPYVCGISSYVEVLKTGLCSLSNQVLIVTSSLHAEKAVFKDGIIRCPAKKANNKYGYACKKYDDRKVIDFICSFHPDVVHINTDTKIGYMGLLIADKLNCPVVFTIHDFFMDRFACSKSKTLWNIRTFFEKKHFCDMIDNADVITSSCRRASLFVQKADRNRRVTMIPMNTDMEYFDYKRITPQTIVKMRQRFGFNINSEVAVFSGDLSVEKNIEFILSAFSKYIKPSDNIQLLIVGDGTETEYLKSVCKKLNITDRVKFSGSLAHSIMPEVYAACDVYVCSSDDSLMSMSVSEAVACGLPVLIREDKEKYSYSMIQNGVNGFVYITQVDFADRLKKLASMTTAQKHILKNVVRRTLNGTSTETMAKNMLSAYNQAIKIHDKKVGIIKNR
ncbi:MAG: glycosyltransferase [Acutalibacteraceae bacterium]